MTHSGLLIRSQAGAEYIQFTWGIPLHDARKPRSSRNKIGSASGTVKCHDRNGGVRHEKRPSGMRDV